MRSSTLSRVDASQSADVSLRLNVTEKRGVYFRNPVSAFSAGNGPANLGVTVQFALNLFTEVQSVEVLRNTARDFGGAVTLQSYPVSDLAANQPVTYYDHDKAIVNQTAYYWLRVVPLHTRFQPIVQGPLLVAVPANGDTSLTAPNDPTNSTNFATVDSIDAGASATARIYGTGGVGSAWMKATGFGVTENFPAGAITGLAYSTSYFVMWTGSNYQAFTAFVNAIPDNFVFVGNVTTVASGGGGGSSGGGGGGGGSGGCCEVGTNLEFADGEQVNLWLEDCDAFVEIETENARRLAVAPDTLVSVFVKAWELREGMLLESFKGSIDRVFRVSRAKRKSKKMVVRVSPGQVYFGGGIRLHNIKRD